MTRHVSADRARRILVRTICATGLLLPAVLGVLVRTILVATGVAVVSWSRGATWVAPLTFIFLIPFLLLAVVANAVLSKVNKRTPQPSTKWLHIFVGAFCGLILIHSYLLINILPDFEQIAHVVAFWWATILLFLFWGTGGMVIGGASGWFTWVMRTRHGSHE